MTQKAADRRWYRSYWAAQLGAAAFAFLTYFSMYAFRKPFAAATYAGEGLFGLDLKTTFVISQVVGYTLSKYLGVKVVSEARRGQRFWLLCGLVVAAELALVALALAPKHVKPLCLFFNGLPLGMVWGLVVRYLEGRRTSELQLAVLSCSFIVASGVVKDVGRWLLREGIPELWMPAASGALFLLPFCIFAGLLDRVPEPDAADVERREARSPMGPEERRRFVTSYLPGVLLLLLVYLVLTAFRDFRDNYGVELFEELGYGVAPALFSKTEIPVALMVLAVLGALGLFQGRISGLISVFAVMSAGLLLISCVTFCASLGWVSGEVWMIGIGFGAYLAYVPFSSFLFDRIMAATRFAGTAVFAITLADAIGYTGSVAIQLYKDLGYAEMSRLRFFNGVSHVLGIGGAVLIAVAGWYFLRRTQPKPSDVLRETRSLP